MVKFKPGDRVSIIASGCVQTGGSGKTWKSYTQPLGDNADHLYSGTISIPGVLEGGLQRIGGAMGDHWVPRDLPPTVLPNLYLTLGYQDDAYSDNGYYAHDNGNNDQCLNVGPAWVEVIVESDLTLGKEPKYSLHTKPFDLAWDMNGGGDANGLPLNPVWGYQLDHNGQQPDFKDICGSAFSTSGFGGTDTSVDDGKLASACTSQTPTTDLCTNGTWMVFGYCPAQPLHGHLNWSIATYVGSLTWESYSGNWPQDHDYNFWLDAKDNAGMTTTEPGVGLEFDGEETLDYFGNTWWGQVLGTHDDTKIAAAINGHQAVVTGLIGIDGAHWDGHSESHPVFAMAIQLSQTERGDMVDEQWVYFVRNSGTEGNCSHSSHAWPGLFGGVYYVSFPWPSSHVTHVSFENSQFWKDGGQNVIASHGTYSGWSYLKFEFPDASAMADGVVTIHYTKATGTGPERKEQTASSHHESHPENEPRWGDIAAHIPDPAIRKQLMDDLIKANPSVKVKPPKRVLVVVDNAVKEHRPPKLAAGKGEMTRDKAADEPKKKAEADATKPLLDKYGKYFQKP